MSKHWPLLAIIVIFTAPFFGASYILYFDGKIKRTTKQNGDLISPAQKVIHPLALEKKWNILYADPNDAQLFDNLYTALGKDRTRVNIAISDWQQGATIIDPNGLYILHYPQPVNANGLLKDLRKLLKYSHVY